MSLVNWKFVLNPQLVATLCSWPFGIENDHPIAADLLITKKTPSHKKKTPENQLNRDLRSWWVPSFFLFCRLKISYSNPAGSLQKKFPEVSPYRWVDRSFSRWDSFGKVKSKNWVYCTRELKRNKKSPDMTWTMEILICEWQDPFHGVFFYKSPFITGYLLIPFLYETTIFWVTAHASYDEHLPFKSLGGYFSPFFVDHHTLP